MSTRSQLRFVRRIESNDNPDEEHHQIAQVYRHCDGYPDGVLRDLAQLKRLLEATRTERGPGYAAAQFLLLDKLGTMELYLDDDPDRNIRADDPADLPNPANMEHLDQPISCWATASRILRTAFTATRNTSTSSSSRLVPPSTTLASGLSR